MAEKKTTPKKAATPSKTRQKHVAKRDEKGRLLPGETANPYGRPLKEHSLTDALKALLDEQPDIKKALMTSVIKQALDKGDMTAIKMLWQYLDGMPTQRQELTGKDGDPIQVQTLADLVVGAAQSHDTITNPDTTSDPQLAS